MVFVAMAVSLTMACESGETEPTSVPTPLPTATATPVPPAPTPAPTPTPTIPTATPRGVVGVAPSVANSLESVGIHPDELLLKSSDAMSQVESFHFDVSGTFSVSTGQSSIEIPLSYVGDVQTPDKSHGLISLSVVVFALEMEIITIGAVTYTTNPESGAWEISEGGGLGIPNLADFSLGGKPPLSNARFLDKKNRDGVDVYKLVGTAQFGTLDAAGQESEATIWIGVDDLLLREITVQADVALDAMGLPVGDMGLGGTGTIGLSIKLSDFGKPVTIEAPTIP